jgi:hypothetical protein
MSDKELKGRYYKMFEDDEESPSKGVWDSIAAQLPTKIDKPIAWYQKPMTWLFVSTLFLGTGLIWYANTFKIAGLETSNNKVAASDKDTGGRAKFSENGQQIVNPEKSMLNEKATEAQKGIVPASVNSIEVDSRSATNGGFANVLKTDNSKLANENKGFKSINHKSIKSLLPSLIAAERRTSIENHGNKTENNSASKAEKSQSSKNGLLDSRFLAYNKKGEATITKKGSNEAELTSSKEEATSEIKPAANDKNNTSNAISKADEILADNKLEDGASLVQGNTGNSLIEEIPLESMPAQALSLDSITVNALLRPILPNPVINNKSGTKFKITAGLGYAYLNRNTEVSRADNVYVSYQSNGALSQKNASYLFGGLRYMPIPHWEFNILAELMNINSFNSFTGDAGELVSNSIVTDAFGNQSIDPQITQYDFTLMQTAKYGGIRLEMVYCFGQTEGLIVKGFGSSSALLSSIQKTEGQLMPGLIVPAFNKRLYTFGGSLGYRYPMGKKNSVEAEANYRIYSNSNASNASFKQQLRAIGVGFRFQF